MKGWVKTIIVSIMAIWQATLTISALIIVKVGWWFWLAVGYMIVLLIIAIMDYVLEEKAKKKEREDSIREWCINNLNGVNDESQKKR